MAEIYGHTFTSAFGPDPTGPVGATWAKGLSGLTGQDLARGLSACLRSGDTFPPTLPRFRMLCIGIPAVERVAHEIRSGERSAFTQMVLQRMDLHRYKAVDAKQAEQLLRSAYSLAVDARMAGEPLPEQVELLGHEPQEKTFTPASPETIAREMAKIEQILADAAKPQEPDQ